MSFTPPNSSDYDTIRACLDNARQTISTASTAFFANASGINVYSGANVFVVGEDPDYDSNWGDWGNGYRDNETGVHVTGIPSLITGIVVFFQKPNINDEKFFGDEIANVRTKVNPQRITLQSEERSKLRAVMDSQAIVYRDNEYEVDSRIMDLNFFGKPYAYQLELKYVSKGDNSIRPDNP